ncbi:MAG: thiamine-phosphate synthase family protein [bacterium]
MAGLIPEVQSNFAYALKNADNLNEVLGFPGRIIRLKDEIKTLAEPSLGASKHMGKVVLTAMRHDPSSRAAMNIKFSDKIINICKKTNLTISEFDRKKEPPAIKTMEGQSLEWGTDIAIRAVIGQLPVVAAGFSLRKQRNLKIAAATQPKGCGYQFPPITDPLPPTVPDIIFDRGAIGKEAMIRVLGKNPDDVAEKIIKIALSFRAVGATRWVARNGRARHRLAPTGKDFSLRSK